MKMLNGSKYSMPWVRCAFGNVFVNLCRDVLPLFVLRQILFSIVFNIPMTSGTPRWWRHRLVLLFCPKLQCTPPLPRPPPLIQSFPRVSFTAFSAFFTASSKISFSMIQTFPGVPFSVISLSLSCTTSVEKFQVFFCNCNLSLVAFISPAIVMSTAFTEVHGRGLDKVDNIL